MHRHNAGPLQYVFKILLWRAVLLAFRWPLGHKLDDVHLRPLYLDSGEGHSRVFDPDRPLDGIKPRVGTNKALHETEVVAGNGFGRP